MRAFPGKQELRSLPVERCAPFDQLLNGGRSVLNERSDGVHVTEAVSGVQSILLVEIYLVVIV
jgi:hypothetical protein